MPSDNIIYYILAYGQVILQLIMYISIIYLICGPLREALYTWSAYLKRASSSPYRSAMVSKNHNIQDE